MTTTNLLIDFFSSENELSCKEAEDMAYMARCAAFDQRLRAQISLRYGVALMFSPTPERLNNLYEMFLRHELPHLTWEKLQIEVSRLADTLRGQASARSERMPQTK